MHPVCIFLTFPHVSTPLLLQTQRLDGVAMPKLGTSDPVKQHRSVLYIDGSCQKGIANEYENEYEGALEENGFQAKNRGFRLVHSTYPQLK